MNWMQMVEIVSAVTLCVVFATVAATMIVALLYLVVLTASDLADLLKKRSGQ